MPAPTEAPSPAKPSTRFASIYLASQSPRRSQLLAQIGVAHALLLADASEDAEALEVVKPGERPAAYVQRVTALKLQAALARLERRGLPRLPVLCADTTVALGSEILGKPEDAAHARRMLRALSGQQHRVYTAVALAVPQGRAAQAGGSRWRTELRLSTSQVRMATLSAAQVRAHVASGEPMGKAGAYAIQGRAQAFIEHMVGSYSGIIGLPLHEVHALLLRARVAMQTTTPTSTG